MAKAQHRIVIVACAICISTLVGCGLSTSLASVRLPEMSVLSNATSGKLPGGSGRSTPKVLSFTNVKVSVDTRTGFFGGRYVTVKITGSITNNTGNPVNADNLPALVWDGGRANAEMTQEKLLPGETCNISWSRELYAGDGSLPTVSFEGPFDFEGLSECEADLNLQLRTLAAGFAEDDARAEAERAAQEQAEAEEAQRIADERAALEACVGLTAAEAYNVAKETSYAPEFEDSFEVDVTNDVIAGRDASKATVTKVSIVDEGWFWSASVTFELDYVEPKAKEERDNKAASIKGLEDCVGVPAGDAYAFARDTEYEPVFRDSEGDDVTNDVIGGGEAAKALVSEVKVDEAFLFWGPEVIFTLDYESPSTKVSKEEAANAEQKQADDRATLEACVGRTAAEAYEIAKGTKYSPLFEDLNGFNIFSDEIEAGGEASKAKVTKVNISEGFLFFSPTVTFEIDYEDPEYKAELEQREADRAAREQERAEQEAKDAQVKQDLMACKGKTVEEAYEVARDSGLPYEFRVGEQFGANVTSDVEDDAYAGARRRVKVTSVIITNRSVKFVIERNLAISAEDNEDVRRLLEADNISDAFISKFVEEYEGKRIEFDGCIVYSVGEEGSEYYFDYIIASGTREDPRMLFQVDHVLYSDFGWVGEGPDTAGSGLNCHFVAEVESGDWMNNEVEGMIFLDPVETTLK